MGNERTRYVDHFLAPLLLNLKKFSDGKAHEPMEVEQACPVSDEDVRLQGAEGLIPHLLIFPRSVWMAAIPLNAVTVPRKGTLSWWAGPDRQAKDV